jgi:phosphatidylserine/phosphatidylglycerophosphate/cardiolipin synthase-like enzyme
MDEMLNALLIAELIAPSSQIWLVSPWISDIPVLDNRSGEVLGLVPGAPVRQLRLTECLLLLAERGAQVQVLSRRDPRNAPVLDRLQGAAAINLHARVVDNLHDKGLLTTRFHLQGSMNFTHFGRAVNEEAVTLTDDPDAVARARVDYAERFGMGAG